MNSAAKFNAHMLTLALSLALPLHPGRRLQLEGRQPRRSDDVARPDPFTAAARRSGLLGVLLHRVMDYRLHGIGAHVPDHGIVRDP